MTRKICLTTLEFPPDVGGVGESVQRIARMIQQLGYSVHVVVFRAKLFAQANDVQRRAGCLSSEQDGIQVHRLQLSTRSATPMIQDFYSEVFVQLKLLHQRYHFDLVHSFFVNETGFVSTLFAKEAGIPTIASIRGSDLHRHIFAPKEHGQICWTLEQADWVTAVSQDLLQRARILAPGILGRSSAFWNSIAPIDFGELPAPTLNLNGPVIGSVGRFREKKGLEYLLDACAQLRDRYAFSLLLVGDFEPRERPYWLAELQRSGLQDRVIVTGMMPRIEALAHLPLIDIFAMPSIHDGCPNALLEAMLAGRAIIGSASDAIGEILRDGHNGLVVPPGSALDLERALQHLLEQPDLRAQLGMAARITALQDLAPAVELSHWQQVYEGVLAPAVVY